jgi:hypothetical protein
MDSNAIDMMIADMERANQITAELANNLRMLNNTPINPPTNNIMDSATAFATLAG